MKRFLRRCTPSQLVALGFLSLIFLGSALLCLPCCLQGGKLRYIDALYTAASAVCVTGLLSVDAGSTFSPMGQAVLAVLIQIGGLGVAVVGAGVIVAMGRRVDLRSRHLVRESMNLHSGGGVVRFLRVVFFITVVCELLGTAGSYVTFSKQYPPLRALWISLFHSIASFNNAGFDILGQGQSLVAYQHDVWLNVVTMVLVVVGGLGFLVLQELWVKRFRWKRLSMHTRVVLCMSAGLIAAGALLLLCTEHMSPLAALFQSVSARTAGFATYPMGSLSNAGLLVMVVLMVIGASPGSTGGGVKTSTVFVLGKSILAAATNRSEKAFRYAIAPNVTRKAAVIVVLALVVVLGGTWALCALQPQLALRDALFEIASAMGTAGLSTGITPTLGVGAKLLCIFIMYIARLGPLTVASVWYFDKGERVRYPDGNIAVG